MIKKFNDFVNESKDNRPKENAANSKSLKLTEEEVNMFYEEGSLHKLIDQEKVSLFGDMVWYLKDDKETIAILDEFFEM